MEGNLTAENIAALKTFAILHPELNIQLDEEPVFLQKENEIFGAKSKVKALHTDELAIAYVEKMLSGTELLNAEHLLKTNLPFQHDVALYKKTIAQADESVVFENKQTLKREPKVIVFTKAFWMRSAAAIALLAGLWIFISNIKESPELNKSLKSVADMPLKKEIETSVNSSNKNNAVEIQNENSNVKPEFASVKSVTKIKANSLASPEHENKTLNTEIEKESINTEKELLAYVNITSPEKETAPVFIKSTYIIEEGSDDEFVAVNTKPVKQNKLMTLASKAFKKLHQKGIEKVNGSDNNNTLVFGAFSVSKND
jgi:hypothetical protein